MGQKLTFEQIKFIEKRVEEGLRPKQIIQLSGLGDRVVRKYIALFKKRVMPFLHVAVLDKGSVEVSLML